MSAPEIIQQLVERFDQHREAYRSGKYNETQLRREFLDPFFEALGWDVLNRLGYSEENKHVIHEDSLEVEGVKKAPDYAFKVGRERKFFVEAKKPSVKIETNPEVAFQLRRYVWSAKLPLGILTDFEEFAVYECRSKPKASDSVKTGRVLLFRYTDYIEKWDEIASIFSHDAVMKGGFDKYANAAAKKKGTAEVDEAFLAEIEGWRDLLARNLALRNKDKIQSERDLNYAVQMTIDRIIFLRICEERGFESENQLHDLALTPSPPPKVGRGESEGRGEGIYSELKKLFERADKRYNSGLFQFKKESGRGSADTFTPGLEVDDKVLKEIVKDLYYPSPYVFSQIPADILGQIYEQFLGKVIRLTAGNQAKVEEKPEVRKAGGVFYTPTYIVDYIVANTVGQIANLTNPTEVAKLKIVDPACGSGTFLLGAYQFLIDWHLRWYVEDDAEKWSKAKNAVLVKVKDGWKLSVAKKKEILLNNIFGVDIDPQAVEVTKLSLLLKVIEDPGQLSYLDERILPDLGRNIQCGNSLIGRDYFEGRLMVDEDERARVNAFDWKQAFPDVFAQGGFDAVIGNPPWGAEFERELEKYIKQKYEVAQTSAIDSYALFIEQSIGILKEGGLIGFITPDTFLRKSELLPTRSFILHKTSLVELIETGPVFSQVRDTWCLVFTASKESPKENTKIHHRKISRFITGAEERLSLFASKNWTSESEVRQRVWMNNPDLMIGYLANETAQRIIDKIEKHSSLGQQSDKYKISRGEEGSKFALANDPAGKFFMVIPQDVERYFLANGIQVKENTLTPTKVDALYRHPKVWIIRIQKMRWKQRVVCVFDERANSAGMKTLQVVVSPNDNAESLKYLSAILSSKLINFWCVNYLADDMNQSYLSRIPIPAINFSDPTDKARHDKMVTLVERMLALHKSLSAAKNPSEQDRLKREVESTDGEIDGLVYELYGLTEEEIRIVKGN